MLSKLPTLKLLFIVNYIIILNIFTMKCNGNSPIKSNFTEKVTVKTICDWMLPSARLTQMSFKHMSKCPSIELHLQPSISS